MKWTDVLTHPCSIAVTGARGSGKTCLAYRLAELLHSTLKLPAYSVGLAASRASLLPGWFTTAPTIADVPAGSVVVIDESSLQFHARRTRANANLEMDRALCLSRQRDQTILLATHTLRKLDVALVADMNLLAFKRPSLLHSKFERAELRHMTAAAADLYHGLPWDQHYRTTYVVAEGFEGVLHNRPPRFWTDELSRGFGAAVSSYEGAFTAHGIVLTPAQLERFDQAESFAHMRERIDREGELSKYSAGVVQARLDGGEGE